MADAFKLVATAGEQTVDVKPGATLVVGRAVSSDVPIYDPTISRQHAQISVLNGGVLVKDLGSSNGTFLNGSRITEATAQPNDVVMFGKVSFYVRELAKATAAAPAAPAAAGPPVKPPAATIVRQLPIGDEAGLSGKVKRLSMEGGLAAIANAPPGDTLATVETAKSAKKLELLLEISKALSRQQEVDKLLETIADMSFQVMAVDYVSILLGPTPEQMVPRISKSRLGGAASSRVPKGIIGPVVADRVALLTDNAAEDQRLKGGTIVQQSVRSAMCAPLLASDGAILGVMYVDNRSAINAYTSDDLDFLIGFSGVASVAIENNALADRLRHEALVLSNFQRFFSPDVARTIAEHGGEMKLDQGTKKEVVILFSDIRGFTSMSERMDPDDVAHMLREYFTEMVDIIFRHGGTLDKFIGDAIMALWGAPLGTDMDADNAIEAAMEMQQKLVELNAHWKETGKPAVQIGIGINSGQVFAGNIGSEQRLEYTVLGDAVNTASRLCSNAGKGEILVSEALFKRLKRKPKSAAREPLKVKNKEQLVPVLLVKVSLSPAALPADYVSWSDDGGLAVARHDVAPFVRHALRDAASLYAWAAARPDREVFHGRGATFAVTLGPARVVVRHARRGGMVRHLLRDRFFGREPRFVREIMLARRLHAAGITTPAVMAGVAYRGLLSHTADIVTERLDGPDLAALLFGTTPPAGEDRAAVFAAVGRLVRRLHAAGFVHPDLQLRNVLILDQAASGERGAGSEAALLDVDTCREVSRHARRAHHANVKRFLRSWAKWNETDRRLTDADLRAFRAAYDEGA